MADNEKKIVLNVPGQTNVDPSEVTQDALTLKDPLSGRDTDTGSLDKMDDTKTRKTVKIKPATGAAAVPVINLGGPTPSVSHVTPAAAPAGISTESTRLKDVLSSRDTDTGSLDKMDDTKTRKTVKLSPISSGAGSVSVMKLGAVAAPAVNTESIPITTLPQPVSPVDDTRTRQTVVLKTPLSPVNTESIPITTLPQPVSPADDTRTRQTVVLKMPLPPAMNTESIPITTLPQPVSPADDTRTRQTVVLKAPSAAVGTESAPLSDVLAGRDTDTGNMERMDDTKTRKTIKLTPLTAGGPISKLTPLVKPAGAPVPVVLPEPGTPPVNLAATVELKPVVLPGQEQGALVSTDTGSLKNVLEDTSTRKTVKLQPLPGASAAADQAKSIVSPTVPQQPVSAPAAPPENLAATVELKPVVLPVPEQAALVSTDTGSLKNVLEDTSTRKTVKLQPLPGAPAAVAPQDAEPMVKETSDETVKLQKTHIPTSAPAHEASSPLPTVAQAKTVVPGSKQTIKLRPSTGGGSVPPEEAAAAVKVAAGTSKDTIKISPLSSNGIAAAGISPSSPTLNLATKAPTPAPAAGVAPSSPTVNLTAPSGLTLKKPALTPVSAPEQKSGLSLPGKAPTVKPPEPVAEEEPQAVEEVALEATGAEEEAGEEKKGGLQLKKREVGEEPQGPPRVQTDLEKIEGSVAAAAAASRGAGQPSMLYFVLALVSVICLAASVYIAAAQYVNYWQQAKVKSKLPVSFVSQFVK